MTLHFSYDVLAALCTREARRGSHLTNSGVIEWERGLGVTGSTVCVWVEHSLSVPTKIEDCS